MSEHAEPSVPSEQNTLDLSDNDYCTGLLSVLEAPEDSAILYAPNTLLRLAIIKHRDPALFYGSFASGIRKNRLLSWFDLERAIAARELEARQILAQQNARPAPNDWYEITLDVTPGEPPARRLVSLLDHSPAKKIWNGQRPDLSPDPEGLRHQQALTLYALSHEWTWQEAHALLAAHRLHLGYPSRDIHYYQHLLWHAHQARITQQSMDILTTAPTPAAVQVVPAEELRAHLATIFGCAIVRVTQEGVDNAIFSVQLNGHLIPVGGADAFSDQKHWKNLLVSHGYRPFDRMKETAWNNVVAALLQIVERHENHETAWIVWLRMALSVYVGQENRDQRSCSYHLLFQTMPYYDEGVIVGFHLEHFRQWASMRFPDARKLTRSTYMALLRQLGFAVKNVTAREEKREEDKPTHVICRSYWVGPSDILDEPLSLADEDLTPVPF